MTFISIILEQRKVADLFDRGRGGRETDRKTECETERDTERETDPQTERGRERQRDRDRNKEIDRERQKKGQREKERETERQRKEQRERDRERKRGRQRDREGGRETEGEAEKETERNRINHWICSVKNCIPKIFAKFTEKYLRCSFTLMELRALPAVGGYIRGCRVARGMFGAAGASIVHCIETVLHCIEASIGLDCF